MPSNIEKEVGLIFDFESEFREGEEFNLVSEEYNKRRFVFMILYKNIIS
jgi:hypothetical protein